MRRSTTFVNDVAEAANINKPLPGGEEINYYRWWDQYYFVQDEWRVAAEPDAEPRAALRAAGQQHSEPDRPEREHRRRPTAATSVFRLNPVPKTDKNNFQPRLGFNWSPTTSDDGIARDADRRRQVRRCAAATRARTTTPSSTSR